MRKKILLVLLGIALAIQLIRPDTAVPAVEPGQDFCQVLQPSAEIETILKSACYDCHSYETRYPWYNNLAPVSWWLANHVREGREHLNFSTFASQRPNEQNHTLKEAIETVEEGEMPLKSYTWTHPDARLSAGQRDALVSWLRGVYRPR